MTHKSNRQNSGFTLVELMIVVAVISILATIAYPAYQNYVLRARRAEAKSALLDIQLAQEKWRTSNPTYATLTQLGYPVDGAGNYTIPEGTYVVSAANITQTTYTLSADPTGAQVNDAACDPMTVDQANNKLPAACW